MSYDISKLDLSPKNYTSLDKIANELLNGYPVRVVLEPGDMTRYEFLMVRMTHTTASGGYRPGTIAHVAVNLGTDGRFFALTPGQTCGPWDFDAYKNEHTREVMAAFYNKLWEIWPL